MTDALKPDANAGASSVTDHPFQRGGRPWWATCAVCRLAEAAHTTTTLRAEDRK